jgi:hypothetical protein
LAKRNVQALEYEAVKKKKMLNKNKKNKQLMFLEQAVRDAVVRRDYLS